MVSPPPGLCQCVLGGVLQPTAGALQKRNESSRWCGVGAGGKASGRNRTPVFQIVNVLGDHPETVRHICGLVGPWLGRGHGPWVMKATGHLRRGDAANTVKSLASGLHLCSEHPGRHQGRSQSPCEESAWVGPSQLSSRTAPHWEPGRRGPPSFLWQIKRWGLHPHPLILPSPWGAGEGSPLVLMSLLTRRCSLVHNENRAHAGHGAACFFPSVQEGPSSSHSGLQTDSGQC